MHTLSQPLAYLIVLLVPVGAVGVVASASDWARWLVRAGGAVGVAGLVLTAVAVVNLAVPRRCAHSPARGDTVNRPVISMVVGDGDCFRSAMAQLELVALAVVTTSATVLARQRPAAAGR